MPTRRNVFVLIIIRRRLTLTMHPTSSVEMTIVVVEAKVLMQAVVSKVPVVVTITRVATRTTTVTTITRIASRNRSSNRRLVRKM